MEPTSRQQAGRSFPNVYTPADAGTMSTQPARRTVALEPRTEFRFETDDGASVSITLVAGAAEVFGAEMVMNRSYSFTDAQQVALPRPLWLSPQQHKLAQLVNAPRASQAVFTWRGCTLDVLGPCGHSYVPPRRHKLVHSAARIQTGGQRCTLIQRASSPTAANCTGGFRDAHGELPAIAHGAGGAPREGKGARHRWAARASDRPQGDRQVFVVSSTRQLPREARRQRHAGRSRRRPGWADASGMRRSCPARASAGHRGAPPAGPRTRLPKRPSNSVPPV